jgi:hypothetical protein
MAELSLTSTYLWDTDISVLRPQKGFMIVEVDDEEMLKIGDTGLILGYYEDNRNNAHWFGKVVSKGDDVPLELGDQVWFSYMSAKAMDRIIAHHRMYIFMEYCDLILVKRGDDIEMLNDNILAVALPPKKHSFLEYYEEDTYYTEIRQVPKGSRYNPLDKVHYWLEQVYELEGQRKLLKENYRVLREENIITILKDGSEEPVYGMVMVELYPLPTAVGNIVISPIKRKIQRGKVIRSTCEIAEGVDVFVRTSRGYKVGNYTLFRMEHVEAVC